MFFRALKLTETWPNATILEKSHAGGYPNPVGPKLPPENPLFSIRDKDWGGTTLHRPCVDSFSEETLKPFPLGQVWETAQMGNEIISHYGSLHLALRAVQEDEMRKLRHLVINAQRHLSTESDFCGDISELRRIGEIPKFRGASPGSFRVRGLPRNPGEQEFMISKRWKYVEEKKMFICTSNGIPSPDEYCCSPSTTVAKKLPDRALSRHKRLILDARRVNLRCSKQDNWPLKTPLIGDLATRYCKLRASFPGLEIRATKRDIDAAFARIRLHPDGAVLFGTEFAPSPTIGDSIVFSILYCLSVFAVLLGSSEESWARCNITTVLSPHGIICGMANDLLKPMYS